MLTLLKKPANYSLRRQKFISATAGLKQRVHRLFIINQLRGPAYFFQKTDRFAGLNRQYYDGYF